MNFAWLILLIQFFSGSEYVTFEQFGAKGDGRDETEVIMQALMHAKSKQLPVRLQGGQYKFSPTQVVDITGIPAIEGAGTIDVSDTGPNASNKSMTHVFRIKGEKQLLEKDVSLREGEREVKLKPGLEILPGDVLFITSSESLPNTRRPYNCKGQRAKVTAYNRASGSLTISDTFYFNITKAYLWKNTVTPFFKVGEQAKFITSKMNFIGCFEIIYSKAEISGSYENFALAAISLRSSEGRFKNVHSELPVTSNNGYSIGISVADMSDGIIIDCKMNGGRHNVSGTGGGLWRKSESGGPEEAAGYPSVMEINGGTYTGSRNVNGISEDNGTIDSHGNVYKMTVRNCTVYGGINVGADYSVIDSISLYTDRKRAFNFGSDVVPGSDWGHCRVINTRIIVDAGNKISVLLTKSDINELVLKNILFEGLDENSLIADFRYPGPKNLKIEDLRYANHDRILKSPRFLVNRASQVNIDEISCLKLEDIKRF